MLFSYVYPHKVLQPEINDEFITRFDPIRKLAEIPPFNERWMSSQTARRDGRSNDEYDYPIYRREGRCYRTIVFEFNSEHGIKRVQTSACPGYARLIIYNPRQFGFEVDASTPLIIEINPSFGVAGYREGIIVRFGREFSFIDRDDVPFEFISQCLCECSTSGETVIY